MNGFEIATDRIDTAATGVESVGAALQGEIATMEAILADLYAGWQSSTAAPRFAAAMDGYLAQARQLAGALVGHGSSLHATARGMADAEVAIAAATPAVLV